MVIGYIGISRKKVESVEKKPDRSGFMPETASRKIATDIGSDSKNG